MSAPGAGKTTLLERRSPASTAPASASWRATSRGASTPTGWPRCTSRSTQLNTDNGFGGECHLDANMVRTALPDLPLDEIDLLVVENVGNLVCPAEFRIGEDARAMVCSVTEGEDKPLKYPLMFRTCELVVINKIDLLPHLDFDLERLARQPRHRQPRRRDDARSAPRPARASRRSASWLPASRIAARHRARAAAGSCLDPGAAAPAAARTGSPSCSSAQRRGEPRASSRPRPTAPRAALPPDGRALRPRRAACRARATRPAARSDVRHVTVEFVHPVIVGKRALPAIGLAREGGPLGAQVGR